MQTLKPYYRRNTYDYHLVLRNQYAAIYEQRDPESQRTVAYEVGKVKYQKETITTHVHFKEGETFWNNEDFGKIAWTLPDKEAAHERYLKITAEATEKASQNAAA